MHKGESHASLLTPSVYAGGAAGGYRHHRRFGWLAVASRSSSREAARRTQCASRMGQLANANMQFEIAKKRYPGYLEPSVQTPGSSSGVKAIKVGTWAVALFPYLEQEPVYELWSDPATRLFGIRTVDIHL